MADAPRRPKGLNARILAAGVLLVGVVAAAPALDGGTDAYRKAAATGAFGAVTGRVLEERRTPDGTERPLAGTIVTLLPRSSALRGRLEEIKMHARDSQSAYVASVGAIRRTREAHEKELGEAGATDLVRATVVDGAGAFALAELPAGEWMLIASRSVFVSRASSRATKRDRETYLPRPRLIGYHRVSVWLRELTIVAGQIQVVELSDRNVWFTGIEEERVLDADP